MDIKRLIWRDNVTDIGKNSGLFEILADVEELGLSYTIRNYKYFGDNIGNKYYLFSFEKDSEIIECTDIETAKNIAQEQFKEMILKLFFEK